MGPFDAAWLAAAIRMSMPLTYAATGELVAQRAGVLNLGLEGMMLAGALGGVLVAWGTDVFGSVSPEALFQAWPWRPSWRPYRSACAPTRSWLASASTS